MPVRKLLDCTLRDGGYVNDWAFGRETMTNLLERLIAANLDVVEIGFLDERRPFDENRSIFPDTASMRRVYGKVDKKQAMLVGMIDYGTCGIEHLEPAADSYLDGIRVIFKKHRMREALDFCAQVKALGYRVFVQAVSITSYSDEDLLALIGLVNALEPYAVSMVDTYGLLHEDGVMHVLSIMDQNLLPGVALGYHAHNNFQMGYANCIEVLGSPTARTLLVDGSLYGMGKSAGNTPVELLAMYFNDRLGGSYDVSQLLEAIETGVMDFYRVSPWGYNFFYFLAASNRCHPNYVSYLLNKQTLSIRSVGEILQAIEPEKKLLYDQKHIEALYLAFQKNVLDDSAALAALRALLAGRPVLVLGPGKTLSTERERVTAYLAAHRPFVLSINHIPADYAPDALFLTNAKRYLQLSAALLEQPGLPLIATSNVTRAAGSFSYVLDYASLIDDTTEIPDNSLVMLLRLFTRIGVRDVALAGFDGYSATEINYLQSRMEYDFSRKKADYLNRYVADYLAATAKDRDLTFVTSTRYRLPD